MNGEWHYRRRHRGYVVNGTWDNRNMSREKERDAGAISILVTTKFNRNSARESVLGIVWVLKEDGSHIDIKLDIRFEINNCSLVLDRSREAGASYYY